MVLGTARAGTEQVTDAAAERLLRSGRLVRAEPRASAGYEAAAFPWPACSPTRPRHPMARGVLVETYREARARLGDPVAAWAEIADAPGGARSHRGARGRGGMVRVGWGEALEIAAAAHVHTVLRHGPDRIAGHTCAQTGSPVPYAIGARFLALLGATLVLCPEGCQDDALPPADGRTADALRRVEAARLVIGPPGPGGPGGGAVGRVDIRLHPRPGTAEALALALGHVVLTEYYAQRRTPAFERAAAFGTDLPFLVELAERDGELRPGPCATRASLGIAGRAGAEQDRAGDVVPVVVDARDDTVRALSAAAGPLLSLHRPGCASAEVVLRPLDGPGGEPGTVTRGVPVREIGGRLVTTVLDLLFARYGVARPGLPGRWPDGYGDASQPGTPAWQERITAVPAASAVEAARAFADAAEETREGTRILVDPAVHAGTRADGALHRIEALAALTGRPGRGPSRAATPWPAAALRGLGALARAEDRVPSVRRATDLAYGCPPAEPGREGADGEGAFAPPAGNGAPVLRGTADLPAGADRHSAAAGRGEGDGARNASACRPRVLTVWHADPLATPPSAEPDVPRRLTGTRTGAGDETPLGGLDLLVCLDTRATPTTLYADLVLPAATRHERHGVVADGAAGRLTVTDPLIRPSWQARTCTDVFLSLARAVSALARGRLGTLHDPIAAPALPATGSLPVAGRPALVRRDYATLADDLAVFAAPETGPLPLDSDAAVCAALVALSQYGPRPGPTEPARPGRQFLYRGPWVGEGCGSGPGRRPAPPGEPDRPRSPAPAHRGLRSVPGTPDPLADGHRSPARAVGGAPAKGRDESPTARRAPARGETR